MRRQIVLEVLIVSALVIGVFGLFVPVYAKYQQADARSWETITLRVMDSMLPFQERYHAHHDRFAYGIYHRARSDQSIYEKIDWKPSVTDKNRYVVHIIGTNAFKVIASSPNDDKLCRLYPAKQPCFDFESYMHHGH